MTWRFFDADGDGVKTFKEFFTVVSQLTFLGLAIFAVVMEGITTEDRYTELELMTIVAASFGAAVFVEFLKIKFSK